ncbi:hypothetical protein ONS95_008820 [Cadophora gregata]|uniref:uncharacterized protein n=1 Tax=Cadophora gregata TaxID=51156 RepID=UPI0026DA977C|nr:uncharacterized protein ONS95_008820 [Cadophora gregata]KAK0123826.1 hypothetical protein ONS95_008820 [Cadophora gregata]
MEEQKGNGKSTASDSDNKNVSRDYVPPPWAPEIDEFITYQFHRAFVTGKTAPAVEAALRAAEDARFRITTKAIARTGIEPAVEVLTQSLDIKSNRKGEGQDDDKLEGEEYPKRKERDFFSRISNSPELVIELVKHIDPKTLVSLYSIHKNVNDIMNGHLTHTMRMCAETQAPESARIFAFTLYESLCCHDPVKRPHPSRPNAVRMVPSLRWLQMVVHREKTVRDILACMARQGHRMPPEMNLALKKMWLVMDIATSARRAQVMHSRYFTALDIFNIQMFVVKLDMRFNDPIEGPGEDDLRRLMLGQRGLTPLCKMLKRTAFTDIGQIIRAVVRYDWEPKPEHRHYSIFGIPPEEIGIGHLEGWGKGRVHLYRPDELVVREAVRRHLDLKNHIMGMMLWGYVDPLTGQDTPATEDEMYMSDDGSAERPKHPLAQDYEWLEIEPKVYEETEELKESNDWKYKQKKKEEAQKRAEEEAAAKAEEAERVAEVMRRVEEASRANEA